MNLKIISEFKKLIKQIKYDIDKSGSKNESITNYFRLKQVEKVVEILESYPHDIKSGEQLEQIKGIGKNTVSRINEIIKNGFLKEIKIESLDRREKKYLTQIEELTQILGIGRNKAYELIVGKNINSIDELKKAYKNGKIELPRDIKLGLKYHKIYQQQIPRAEMDKINNYLNKVVKSIDKNLCLVICGSYRRGKNVSNDIDILLVHKKVKTKKELEKNQNYLKILVNKLKGEKFIVDDININYDVQYMGFCKLSRLPVRRVDIIYVPYDSYYTALLHFTGSGSFNRKLRLLSKQSGYMLSQNGLYVVKNGKKIRRIKINSEKDIFTKLGLEYIPPDLRV
jgi:DNA polymerase/3'-5' exonuclease PolX